MNLGNAALRQPASERLGSLSGFDCKAEPAILNRVSNLGSGGKTDLERDRLLGIRGRDSAAGFGKVSRSWTDWLEMDGR